MSRKAGDMAHGARRYRARLKVAVSANGDKAAVWGESSGVRVVDLPGGTPVIDVSREAAPSPGS